MSLKITRIQINSTRNTSKIVGFAKVTFCDSFCVDGIKIIDGSKGLFIGMPSNKAKDGTYRDIAFPINAETRKMMTDKILAEYEKHDSGSSGSDGDPF